MQHEIVDNFLPPEQFEIVRSFVVGANTAWYFQNRVGTLTDDSDYYFIHTLYHENKINSEHFAQIQPLLNLIDPKALLRIRALMYMGKPDLIEHAPHKDFPFSHKTCVFYINSNNGFTRLSDGTKVESVANRALFLDGGELHNSATCTDQDRRLVLTINYF